MWIRKKYFVRIKDNKVAYTVVKTKRKTIGITIDMNGEVKVSALMVKYTHTLLW
jgi:hypothetical protein